MLPISTSNRSWLDGITYRYTSSLADLLSTLLSYDAAGRLTAAALLQEHPALAGWVGIRPQATPASASASASASAFDPTLTSAQASIPRTSASSAVDSPSVATPAPPITAVTVPSRRACTVAFKDDLVSSLPLSIPRYCPPTYPTSPIIKTVPFGCRTDLSTPSASVSPQHQQPPSPQMSSFSTTGNYLAQLLPATNLSPLHSMSCSSEDQLQTTVESLEDDSSLINKYPACLLGSDTDSDLSTSQLSESECGSRGGITDTCIDGDVLASVSALSAEAAASVLPVPAVTSSTTAAAVPLVGACRLSLEMWRESHCARDWAARLIGEISEFVSQHLQ